MAALSFCAFPHRKSLNLHPDTDSPWLRFIRQRLDDKVHFWPFDGWEIPSGKSALLEVYPSLWSRTFPRAERTQDQQDAYAVAAWMQQADIDGRLGEYLDPGLDPSEKLVAGVEGWILGVR